MRRQILTASAAVFFISASVVRGEDDKKPILKPSSLGETRNVHAFDKILLCGQPSAEEFAAARDRGIKTIITLRRKGEINWDEAGTVKSLGLGYHDFGFGPPESLTNDILDKSMKVMGDPANKPFMLHCASANRVGAVWLAHRVLNDGISVDDARKEAKTVGLRTAGYENKVLAYIRAQKDAQQEKRP